MSYITHTLQRLEFMSTQVSIWGDVGQITQEDLALLAPLADYFSSVIEAIEARRSLHNQGILSRPPLQLPTESFNIDQRAEKTDQKLMAAREKMNNAR